MKKFFDGLAEIFEIEPNEVSESLALASVAWDSLAIVSTIALIDEQFDVMVDGQALASCETIGDIQKLITSAQNS